MNVSPQWHITRDDGDEEGVKYGEENIEPGAKVSAYKLAVRLKAT